MLMLPRGAYRVSLGTMLMLPRGAYRVSLGTYNIECVRNVVKKPLISTCRILSQPAKRVLLCLMYLVTGLLFTVCVVG